MRTTSRAVIITLGLLLAGAGAAWAADTCFKDNFDSVLVAKALLLPPPGNCKTVNGYFVDQDYAASGNACRTSDGTKIIFNLFSSASTNLNVIYTFQVPSPTLTGGGGTNCQLKIGAGTPPQYVCVGMSIGKIICPNPRPFGAP